MRLLKAIHLRLLLATAVTLTLTAPLPIADSQRQVAQAHQVEIVEDVGATLHIEPNDTPLAGEEILAWFALTRKGGQTIPLADCDCQLSVYPQPKGDAASLTPPLSAVNAEGYEDIPGARFTFPNVGAYTLELSGSPKQAEAFTPFTLAFDVTVARQQSGTTLSPESASSETVSSLAVEAPVDPEETAAATSTEGVNPTKLILSSIGGLLLLGFLFFFFKRKPRP